VLPYLILGATYAFAAAVQPGPLQTYLVSQTLSNGWRRTVPAALAPLLSDGPIILLVLLVLSHLPARLEHVLRCAGGVFLLYLAATAYRTWRDYNGTRGDVTRSARQSVMSAAVVNLLNPNPYLGWSLVLGPLLLKGWRETPANGIALVVGFYGTMILTLAGIITLFAGAGAVGPRVGRGLVGLSAIALACFGCYQLWSGTSGLLGAFGILTFVSVVTWNRRPLA
jgi:threonine/homoserine/homoserine lactone efflux protein